MSMYKLLFIDEEQETLDDFVDYVDEFNSKESLCVDTHLPLSDIDDMVDLVIKVAPDALIVDFRLNEIKTYVRENIPYDGVDLVQAYHTIRHGFPCFVLTALDDEAVNKSEDVNIVYVKNIIHKKEEEAAKAKFLDRVLRQIKSYKFRLDDAEKELSELIERRKSGDADVSIEARIIELDAFLEKAIDARSAIPAEFKKLSNSERLDCILLKVNELLSKL